MTSISRSYDNNETECDVPAVDEEVCEAIREMVYDVEFKNVQQGILNSIETACASKAFDVEIFFDSFPMSSKRIEEAIKLYLSLYVNFPDNLDDIVEIANGYIEIIEQENEFSFSEKESIYSSIIISLYSPQIWN